MEDRPEIDAFDQIHVVSDLHLGGAPGFQIFNQTDALARLIDYVATRPGKVAFVVNGDFVDFLACQSPSLVPDQPPVYLDASGAVAKLADVVRSFSRVFEALKRLTAKPDKFLVVTLGNHDVELALPEVAKALEEHCADEGNRDRVIFAQDREGWNATVGGHLVHVVHGNDVDDWNLVSRFDLGRFIDARRRGLDPRWEPNAGTRLVIDVMNTIKKSYAWVDLLKPETVMVPGILLALPDRSSLLKKIPDLLAKFARIFARKTGDGLRIASGMFLGEDGDGAGGEEVDEAAALQALLEQGGFAMPVGSGAEWLVQANKDFGQGLQALDLAGDGQLGAGDDAKLILRTMQSPGPDDLRRALQRYLGSDDTFNVTAADQTYTDVDDHSPEDARFVIAGHTHLRRMLARRRVEGVYFNTGTWIRLMQLQPEQLATLDRFQPIYEVLTTKGDNGESLRALDDAKLCTLTNTLVSIFRSDGSVRSELRSATEPNPDEPFRAIAKYAPFPEKNR